MQTNMTLALQFTTVLTHSMPAHFINVSEFLEFSFILSCKLQVKFHTKLNAEFQHWLLKIERQGRGDKSCF